MPTRYKDTDAPPLPRPTLRRLRLVPVATVAVVAIFATACAGFSPTPATAARPTAPAYVAAQLAQLVIADEDPEAPYSAEIRAMEWGDGWDTRGHGCDTRDVVLQRDADAAVAIGPKCRLSCASPGQCWTSPYDGAATDDPRDLQIDHIVPVAEAARSPIVGPTGQPAEPAQIAWPSSRKHQYYEDLDNLVPVTARVNSAKGDGDPAEWKPPLRTSWCGYAKAYVSIKAKWAITVDRAEYNALDEMLAGCSDSSTSHTATATATTAQ